MHTITRFPVAFRRGADGAPFRIAAIFVLLYIATPQFITDPVAIDLKYLLAALLMGCFAWLGATRAINLSPAFLLAPLLLTVFGGISLAYSTFVSPGTSTYSSALIPLVIVAMPLLIANATARTDGPHVARYLIALCCVAAVCHVMWQVIAHVLGWEDGETYYGWLQGRGHEGTLMIVNLMVLAGLFRRRALLALSILLGGLSLLLRPTSTLVFASAFAAGVITLDRLRLRKFVRLACMVLALTVVAENLAVLESESLTNALYSIEPLVKERALDADDNNEFRLGVLAAARDEITRNSRLVGKAFIGNVAV
ncbi:MAG: hypothetical protein JO227_01205, partial [Acetobacteraceae bacterium]|nr:hypothetical protein [Acetobacteraceae bacterium]